MSGEELSGTVFQEDMSQVSEDTNVEPGKWYQIRVSKVTSQEVELEGGANTIRHAFNLSVVSGEDWIGSVIWVGCKMNNQFGRATLKKIYRVAGYEPGAGGHDPQQVANSEFYVKPTENIIKAGPNAGQKMQNVNVQNIRSLEEGIPAGEEMAG